MRKLYKLLILIIIIFKANCFTHVAFANDSVAPIINKQLEKLELDESESVLDGIKLDSSNEYLEKFNIKDFIKDVVSGDVSITPTTVMKGILGLTFGEIHTYLLLMGKLIILAIFCTLLSTLSISFKSRSTSEVAFYVCYIVLIIALTESFLVSMNIVQVTIDEMAIIIKASIPVLITLLISTGNISSGGIFQPLIISSIQIATSIIRNGVVPLVFFVSVLQIVSNISEDIKIDKLVDLGYGLVKWSLRGIVAVFMAITSLYGLTTPFIDGTINKAAKGMVEGFVPVVGDALSGTIDLVMNCSNIVKNSYTVGVIIVILLISAIPMIKIFLCMVVYRLTSAIIEPISDRRISDCMAGMGKSTGYLMGTLSTVVVLFILNMLILIGASNVTTMIS